MKYDSGKKYLLDAYSIEEHNKMLADMLAIISTTKTRTKRFVYYLEENLRFFLHLYAIHDEEGNFTPIDDLFLHCVKLIDLVGYNQSFTCVLQCWFEKDGEEITLHRLNKPHRNLHKYRYSYSDDPDDIPF
jgi:hypothetical protein